MSRDMPRLLRQCVRMKYAPTTTLGPMGISHRAIEGDPLGYPANSCHYLVWGFAISDVDAVRLRQNREKQEPTAFHP